jgi:hypothetical protein
MGSVPVRRAVGKIGIASLAGVSATASLFTVASCGVIAGLDKNYETVPCLDDCADAAPDGAPFCATQDASLCWSFDEPPFVTGPGLVSRGPSGATTLTTNAPKSAPNALAVSFTTDAFVGLEHQQVSAQDHVSCALDVRIDSPGAADIIILELRGPLSGVNRINLTPVGDEVSFRLATVQHGSPVLRPIGIHPVAVWVHVALEIDAVNLVAKGTAEDSTATAPLASDAGPWGVDEVTLGASTQDAPTEWHLSFDNFYCTGL